jgi:hypothetical protein
MEKLYHEVKGRKNKRRIKLIIIMGGVLSKLEDLGIGDTHI